jgi:hypothetical protein
MTYDSQHASDKAMKLGIHTVPEHIRLLLLLVFPCQFGTLKACPAYLTNHCPSTELPRIATSTESTTDVFLQTDTFAPL